MIKKYFWLVLICVVFLVTRLYKINSIPASVYWDEASIGYNAYSITQDLKDEWGEFLPLHFRAFGEFKLPVYIYSVAFFVKLIGLNAVSVRLPAVFFGLGSVITLYFLILKISENKIAANLASFVFSLTPWFFIFTRTGYEATAGLFFFLLFVYFLIQEKSKTVYWAIIFAIASIYSYNAFRILTPLFFGVWFLKQRKKSKHTFFAILLFVVSLLPIVRLYYYDYGGVRLSTIGVKIPTEFVSNYFSHFTYNFLFKSGDLNNRSQIPNWGQIFFVGLPLVILGFVRLLKKKSKYNWIIYLFLLAGPIPAALTRESPHALRALLLAPTFASLSALGALRLTERFGVKMYRNLFLGGVVFVYLCFFGRYYMDFIKNYNNQTYSDWQNEYKEIFTDLNHTSGNVTVTDKYAQPYIFALYYLKYPPQEFRNTVKYNGVDKWGFSTVASFGNFEFHD